jgi:membrane fusion protein, multidrug efflux system
MSKRNWIILGVVVIICVVFAVVRLRRSSAQKAAAAADPAANRAIPVAASPVVARDVPIFLSGLGSVTAFNTVTVKSRVDGQLVRVNFKEGQEVKQGEVLAQIDPRSYQATLDQARANLAKDQASLTDAQTNLVRYTALMAEGVIAQQQLDTQRSLVGQLQGALGADRAQIENAALQVSYTRIIAPISGRIGLRLVDVGNMVHASDPNGLFVITEIQPIAVIFTLPEDDIPTVMAHMKTGPLTVDAYTRDDKTKIASGKLVTVNNEIDPTTGTDKFKAVFDNVDRALWPNQFVNIRLLLDVKKNALTIPAAAPQRGSQGTFVYVVKADKTVEARPIQVGVTEGSYVSVDQGLAAGELVVTDGQDKLQPGGKVTVQQDNAPGRQQQQPPQPQQPQQQPQRRQKSQPAAPGSQ